MPTPQTDLVPFTPPSPAVRRAPIAVHPEPLDPLSAKRAKQAARDRAFTREQQQVIGEILETWWNMKMAGIETAKVVEATEKLPADIAALRAEFEDMKARLFR